MFAIQIPTVFKNYNDGVIWKFLILCGRGGLNFRDVILDALKAKVMGIANQKYVKFKNERIKLPLINTSGAPWSSGLIRQ